MPMPRNFSQVSKQAGASPAAARQGPNPGAWVSGTVNSVGENLDGKIQVSLDNGRTVYAQVVIDEPFGYGARVWVVDAGSDSLVVALA